MARFHRETGHLPFGGNTGTEAYQSLTADLDASLVQIGPCLRGIASEVLAGSYNRQWQPPHKGAYPPWTTLFEVAAAAEIHRRVRRRPRDDVSVSRNLDLVVGPVSTLVGVGLGYVSSRLVSKAERDAASRADLRHAVSRYLGALYPAVAQLRAMPGVEPGLLSDLLDRVRGEAATYVRTQQQLASLGSRHLALADQLVAAYAGLIVMPVPSRLRAAVDASFAWVGELGESRSDEVKGRWPAIWAELDAATAALAEDQGEQPAWRRQLLGRRDGAEAKTAKAD